MFGEIGPDFHKFRSASAFPPGWGFCPDNDISGGEALWVGTRKVSCRVATALRMAAQSRHHSKSALGDFYRRLRAKAPPRPLLPLRTGSLALSFTSFHTRQECDNSKFAADQLRHQKRQEIKLGAKARSVGFEIIP